MVLLSFVKLNKVNEALGCLIEYYIFFTGVMSLFIFRYLITEYLLSVSQAILFVVCFDSLINTLALLTIALNSLRMIYKCEGTLSFRKYKTQMINMKMMAIESNAFDVLKHNKHSAGAKTPIVSKAGEINAEKKNSDKLIVDLSVNINQFLNFGRKNYDIFLQCLGHCFTIESLLFVQEVSVFYHAVQRKFRNDMEFKNQQGLFVQNAFQIFTHFE